MRLTGVVLAAGLAILTTGCTPAATTSPPAESLGTQVFTPCQEVFRPGRTIIRSEALTACAAVDGSSRTPQYIRCADGRRLWRVDETMSTEPGWGFGGSTFFASPDLDTDPDLAAAQRRCRN
ncbi:hypothetical protein [Catenuloplanes japonicus]|uniref:hypothetical protein n=1 Tax=Catenuloplanes japonicus TaxID=33876 RepID=UPI00052744B3|nr:hypothetical protein [Catenuloplanes japonicus]